MLIRVFSDIMMLHMCLNNIILSCENSGARRRRPLRPTRCIVLKCVAVCCSLIPYEYPFGQPVALCCSVLQCVTVLSRTNTTLVYPHITLAPTNPSTYTHIHTRRHTDTHERTHTHTHTHTNTHTRTHDYAHAHTHTYTYTHIHPPAQTLHHIYTHAYSYTYSYTYKHAQHAPA